MDLASLAAAKPEATPAASFQTVFAMALQSLVTPGAHRRGDPAGAGERRAGRERAARARERRAPCRAAPPPTAVQQRRARTAVRPGTAEEQPASAPIGRGHCRNPGGSRGAGSRVKSSGAASGPEPMPSRRAATVLPAAVAKAGTAVHRRIPVRWRPSPHPAVSETNRDEHEASGAGGVAPGRPDDGNRELAGQAGSSDQATPVAVAPAVPALVVPAGVGPIAQADGSSEPLTHERPERAAARLPVVPHTAGQPRPRTVPLRGPAAAATGGSDAGSAATPHDAVAAGEHAVPGQRRARGPEARGHARRGPARRCTRAFGDDARARRARGHRGAARHGGRVADAAQISRTDRSGGRDSRSRAAREATRPACPGRRREGRDRCRDQARECRARPRARVFARRARSGSRRERSGNPHRRAARRQPHAAPCRGGIGTNRGGPHG